MADYFPQWLTSQHNHLLATLTTETYTRVAPHLERVSLPLGTVLYESGDIQSHAYFPFDSIVSLQYMTENGASAEFAMVGNEGLVGVALFMGDDTTSSRAVVKNAGSAYRLSSQCVKDEFDRHGDMLHLMLRYTQALFTQLAQSAVCNRHHTIEQRLCRYLLMSLDCLASSELTITQDLIAQMLGVRREGVTEAAGKLQRLGVINCRRGHLRVLNRAHLEHLSCECYALVKNEFDRLLPTAPRRSQPQNRTLAYTESATSSALGFTPPRYRSLDTQCTATPKNHRQLQQKVATAPKGGNAPFHKM